jgi:hypothetical protein
MLRYWPTRVTTALRKLGVMIVLSAAIAYLGPSSARATDRSPCGPVVDKGTPTGFVQYCELKGPFNDWVPVYASRAQNGNRIGGNGIVGWLTHRGFANWFWCQTDGNLAYNEWAYNIAGSEASSVWAKTMTSVEPGPPYGTLHVQGWVPAFYFRNEAEWQNGRWVTFADANLRTELRGC